MIEIVFSNIKPLGTVTVMRDGKYIFYGYFNARDMYKNINIIPAELRREIGIENWRYQSPHPDESLLLDAGFTLAEKNEYKESPDGRVYYMYRYTRENNKPTMGRPAFYDETMKDVTLRMTPTHNQWLLDEAKRRGISKAQLVRSLIESEMEKVNDGK